MTKPYAEYLDAAPSWWGHSLEYYSESPASAFLQEIVHISDAMNHCRRHFAVKKDGSFTKDSQDSLHRLAAAALTAIMGHVENFERFLFSGLFEVTRFDPKFDISSCCSRLVKDQKVVVDLARISAYRGQPTPIGQLVADNLVGWHDPSHVNAYFRALVPTVTVFANDECEELRVLWQLRHSVSHTAGWLTKPDAQKVKELAALGDSPIVLGPVFITAVARRLHPVASNAVIRLRDRVLSQLPASIPEVDRQAVELFFEVKSPRASWLRAKTVTEAAAKADA